MASWIKAMSLMNDYSFFKYQAKLANTGYAEDEGELVRCINETSIIVDSGKILMGPIDLYDVYTRVEAMRKIAAFLVPCFVHRGAKPRGNAPTRKSGLPRCHRFESRLGERRGSALSASF